MFEKSIRILSKIHFEHFDVVLVNVVFDQNLSHPVPFAGDVDALDGLSQPDPATTSFVHSSEFPQVFAFDDGEALALRGLSQPAPLFLSVSSDPQGVEFFGEDFAHPPPTALGD